MRNEIIQLLNQPVEPGAYKQLTKCLEDNTDAFFSGIIRSLFYRPNHTVLVLEGYSDFFFEELMWDESLVGIGIYQSLITPKSFTKETLGLPNSDNFFVGIHDELPVAYKRLTSYYSCVSKWEFPQRKNYVVSRLIHPFTGDRLNLWRDIFQTFKP